MRNRHATSPSRIAAICVLVLLGALAAPIAAPARPVLAQEVTYAEFGPSADTYVASGRPQQSWPDFRTIWVGYDPAQGYKAQRALLAFDLGQVPAGSTIQSAQLTLYLSATTSGDGPMAVSVYGVGNPWPENVTWNGQPQLSAAPVATTSVTSQLGWHSWDVTSLVQQWAHGQPNYGLMLIGDESGGQHERAFWSSECESQTCGSNTPRLQIYYLTPPRPAELTLRMYNDPHGCMWSGEQIRYTISYANTGGEDLIDLYIWSSFPIETQYTWLADPDDPDTTWIDDARLLWYLGDLPVGESGELHYVVRVPDSSFNSASDWRFDAAAAQPGAARDELLCGLKASASATWWPDEACGQIRAGPVYVTNDVSSLYLPLVRKR